MSSDFKTEQERFWAGDFGASYIARNEGEQLLASNLSFFAKALARARGIETCIEYGANVGMNLRALQLLYPTQIQDAVEINPTACDHLRELLSPERVHEGSMLDFRHDRAWDLVLIKGVLIHVNPDVLDQVYALLVQTCRKYLLVAEYYNPVPVAIPYRGHDGKLFKRDFVGEILDRHPALRLADYGFAYRRDPVFPQDDINWFLLEVGR